MINTRYLIFTDNSSNPEVILKKSTSSGKWNKLPVQIDLSDALTSGTPSNSLSLQAQPCQRPNMHSIKVYTRNIAQVQDHVRSKSYLKLFKVSDPQFLKGMNNRYNCGGINNGNILKNLAPAIVAPVAVVTATPVSPRTPKVRNKRGTIPITKYINGVKHLWTGRDGWKEVIRRGDPRYSTADRNIYYKKYLKYKQKYLALKKELAEDN